MATGEVDLKTLLEHDYKMIQSIADTSRVLVKEMDASHSWIGQSIALFKRLINISANVAKLIGSCEVYWDNKEAFTKPEVIKLWKTAAGLWSALPAEQKKFDDHVARRRRDRIMGQTVEEDPEIEEERLIAENAAYDQLLEEISADCLAMQTRITAMPDGLVPVAKEESTEAEPPAEPASADEKSDEQESAEAAGDIGI